MEADAASVRTGASFDPEPRICCVHLRCKSMFYRVDERPGLLHWSNSMGYWCAVTNDTVGPDGDGARHPVCQQGRGCFAPGPRV